MSAWVVVLVVIVVIVLGAPIRARTRRNARHPATASLPAARGATAAISGRVTVTVDFRIDDASRPAVQRLIERVAAPYLADPTVRAVEVRDIGGRVIGVRHPRPEPRIPPAGSDPLTAR